MRDATSTALSNVVERSPVAWRMSVGAVIRWRSSAMSTSWRPIRLATAFSGEVDMRWSSSNQRICSSVASGMKRDVKTRRNTGSSLAQPTRIMLRYVSSSAWPSASRTTGIAADRAVEHEPRHALRVGDRVGQRDGRAARHAEEREPVEPDRVDDRLEVAQPGSSEKSSTSQSDMPKPRSS